jgi:hypothetical protein
MVTYINNIWQFLTEYLAFSAQTLVLLLQLVSTTRPLIGGKLFFKKKDCKQKAGKWIAENAQAIRL